MRRTDSPRARAFTLIAMLVAIATSCGRVLEDDCTASSDGGACDGADSSRDGSGATSCGPGFVEVDGICEPSNSSDANAVSPMDAADAGDAMALLEPCLAGGNRFFIAGDDYVYSGPPLTLGADENWLAGAPFYAIDGSAAAVSIQVWDRSPGPMTNQFSVLFSTTALGEPVEVRDYPSFDTLGQDGGAAFEVGGDGHGCDHVSGDVHVYEITSSVNDASEADLHSFTATFVQHCERHARYNYGCVHVENCRNESCPPFSGDP